MPKALIIGAGIGGLTAALAFHQIGWEVTVFEQADRLEEVGAGIQLSPNAMKVAAALGLADQIAEQAFAPQALEMRFGQSGRSIFSIPLGEAQRTRWGAPYLHCHRADLVTVLASALDARAPGALQLGMRLARYEDSERGVTAHFETGDTAEGDILIGADGIHSAVRAQMLGPDQPRFTGNVAWRAVVPMDELGEHVPPPTACVWVGRGRHAVTYRLRGGELANFVGVVERDDWQSESWVERGQKADALSDFSGWHPVVTTLIKKAQQHYRWALFDRAPLPNWSEGRTVLIGDAAHPTLPFLAQGAAMAMEDALVLARLCADQPDHPGAALARLYARRINRTSAIQKGSRTNMRRFHQRGEFGRLMTYGPMALAGRLAPAAIRAQQDWIYSYDPVAALR